MKLWPFSKTVQTKDRSFDEILRVMFTNMVSSGVSVTPANALECTTVHAIVRAVTNAIGSFPVMVFRETQAGDGKSTRVPQPQHEVMQLLRRPNSRQTTSQFLRRAMTHVLLWGNHVSVKGQGRSGPIGFLRPLHPDQISVEDDDELNPTYKVTFNEGTRTYRADSLLHITGGISVKGAWAESPVEKCAEAIGLSIAAERLLGELYNNGAIPSFLLTGGKFTSKEQYDAWIQSFKQVYGKGGNRLGVAMLPDGMDAKEITFRPIDAQLLESRRFQRTEIASVYGVPPHKLADLERATFSNITHQSLEFLQDVALPYVRLFEECMERDLLTDEDRDRGYVIRFDLDGAERADFKSRVEGYAKLHSVGAISPNEIRAREGMNPRTDDDGDAYVTPLNMRMSGEGDNDNEGDEESERGLADEEQQSSPVRIV